MRKLFFLFALLFTISVSAEVMPRAYQIQVSSNNLQTFPVYTATNLQGVLTWMDQNWDNWGIRVASGVSNRNFSTVSNYIASLNASVQSNCYLVFDGGPWYISNNLTISSNFVLDIRAGSILNIASGKVLTVNGYVRDGMHQMFDSPTMLKAHTGDNDTWEPQGKVAGLQFARPEWFGGFVNDETADAMPIISAAFASKDVLLATGIYDIDRTLWFHNEDHSLLLRGSGKDSTRVRQRQVVSQDSHDSATWVPFTTATMGTYTQGVASAMFWVQPVPAAIVTTNHVTVQDIWWDCGYDYLQGLTGDDGEQLYRGFSHRLGSMLGSGHTVQRCKISNFGAALYGAECIVLSYNIYSTNCVDPCYFVDNEVCNSGTPGDGKTARSQVTLLMQAGATMDAQIVSALAEYSNLIDAKWSICEPIATAPLVVRGNVIHDVPGQYASGTNTATFVELLPITHGVVEDNFIYDCPGVHITIQDTWRADNVTFRNNVALGIRHGIIMYRSKWAGKFANVLIENNYFTFADVLPNSARNYLSIPVEMGDGGYTGLWLATNYVASLYPTFSNIIVRGNTFLREKTRGVLTNGTYGLSIRLNSESYQLMDDGGTTSRYHTVLHTNVQWQAITIADNIIEDLGAQQLMRPIYATVYPTKTNWAGLDASIKDGSFLTLRNNRNLEGELLDAFFLDGSIIPDPLDPGRGHLASMENILAPDGGFGDISSWLYPIYAVNELPVTNWNSWFCNSSVSAGVYERATNESLFGQYSFKITMTDRSNECTNAYSYVGSLGSAWATAPRTNGFCAEPNAYYTVGCFFKTYSTGIYAGVAGSIGNVSTFPGSGLLTPGVWTHISRHFKSGTVKTNNMFDIAYNVVGFNAPTGTVVYLDNAYICPGYWPTNQYPIVEERNVFTNISYAAAVARPPVYAGQELYYEPSNLWLKAGSISLTNPLTWIRMN